MAPLPPPAPLIAPSSEKPASGAKYHQSFSSAAGESFSDELGLESPVEAATSPLTSASPTSPIDMASPTLSYPGLPSIFGSPSVSSPTESIDSSQPRHLNPAALSSSAGSPFNEIGRAHV